MTPGTRDLQAVLDAVLDGIVVVDRDGRIEQINASGSRILEVSPEAAAGRALEEVIGRGHEAVALVRNAVRTARTAAASEVRVERRHDQDALVDLAASPLFGGEHGDARRVDGAVLRLHDRTLQVSLQSRASERERLQVFGRIATGIAHEVKNPLGGIRGAGELLAARAPDARTAETAKLVVREVDRISALLDDLMIFGHNEKAKLQPVNLHRVIDDVLDLLAMDPAARGVRIERAYDPSIPELLADPSRLTQVFLNLGRNALQAMEEDPGTLTVGTGTRVAHRMGARDGEKLPVVVAEVRDTGPGIPDDLLDKVAIPFFTTRERGSGLGIAISQHWMAQQGGTLRLESRPGHGTSAWVELPLRAVS